MKLYIKMIKPMLSVPTSSQDYTPKYIPVESEDKWYQEDERESLVKKYEHLETTFDYLAFEEKYKEFEMVLNVNGKWISVKDELPEINEPILFTGKNTFGNRYPAQKGYFSGDEWYSSGLIDNCSDGVTHWMPLPEPPKDC